jgi:signal transduction histidine kinase
MARTAAPPPRPDVLPWSPVEALSVFVDLLAQVESAETDSSEFYDRLCEATCRLAHLSRAVIFVWDDSRQRVRAVGSKDVPLDAFTHTRVSPANVPIARAALADDRVVEAYGAFEDQLPPEFVERLEPRNLVCTPMSAAGVWAGVIMGEHKGEGPLTEAERHTLWVLGKVAALAASARIATRQQERSRQLSQHIELAREVHDSVMQRLFGVGLVLDSGSEQLPADDRVRCAEQVNAARQELAAAMQRPLGRTPAPASVSLADEVARLESAHAGLHVDSDWELGVSIPQRFEGLAQNVLAEALRNARKHATPTKVTARIERDGGAAVLEVVNDGCREPAASPGMGLRLAGQDAANRGAALDWGPLRGDRWVVRLRMPLEAS